MGDKTYVKKEKKDVGYSKGMPARHCGICEYYIRPEGENCRRVKGHVLEDMWCQLFEENC